MARTTELQMITSQSAHHTPSRRKNDAPPGSGAMHNSCAHPTAVRWCRQQRAPLVRMRTTTPGRTVDPLRVGSCIRRWSNSVATVKLAGVQTQTVVSDPSPLKARLTGGQKWMLAGLLFLQIPASLIFYPLAAVFAITGIFVPIAMVLVGIGTLPYSFAMRCKDTWQSGPARVEPDLVGHSTDPADASG